MYESPSTRQANDDFMSRLANFKLKSEPATKELEPKVTLTPEQKVSPPTWNIFATQPNTPVVTVAPAPTIARAPTPSLASYVSALSRTPRVLGTGIGPGVDDKIAVAPLVPRDVPGWPPKSGDTEVPKSDADGTKAPSLASTLNLNRTRHSVSGLLTRQPMDKDGGLADVISRSSASDGAHGADVYNGNDDEFEDRVSFDGGRSDEASEVDDTADVNEVLSGLKARQHSMLKTDSKLSLSKHTSARSKTMGSFRQAARSVPSITAQQQPSALIQKQAVPSPSMTAAAALLLETIHAFVSDPDDKTNGKKPNEKPSASSADYSLVDYLLDRQIQQRHEVAENKARVQAQRDEINRYKEALKGISVSRGVTTEAARAAQFHSANAKLRAGMEEKKVNGGNISDAVNELYGNGKHKHSGGITHGPRGLATTSPTTESYITKKHRATAPTTDSSAFHDPRFPLLSAAHRKEVLQLYAQAQRGKDLLRVAGHIIREALVAPAARYGDTAAEDMHYPTSSGSGGIPYVIVDALADLTSRVDERRREREVFLTQYQRASAAADRMGGNKGNQAADDNIAQPSADGSIAIEYDASFSSPAPRAPQPVSSSVLSPVSFAPLQSTTEKSPSGDSYLRGALQYLQSLQFEEWAGNGGHGPIMSIFDVHRQRLAEAEERANQAAADMAEADTQRLAMGLRGNPNEGEYPNQATAHVPKGRARRDTAFPRGGNPLLNKAALLAGKENDEADVANPYAIIQRRGPEGPIKDADGSLLESEEFEEDDDDCSSQRLDGSADGADAPDANTPSPFSLMNRSKSASERICRAAQAQHPLALDEEMARREKLRQLFVEDIQSQTASLSIPGRKLAASLPKEFAINSLSRAMNPTVEKNPYRFSPPAAQRCLPGSAGGGAQQQKKSRQKDLYGMNGDDASSSQIRRRRSMMEDTASKSSRALTNKNSYRDARDLTQRSESILGRSGQYPTDDASSQLARNPSVRFANHPSDRDRGSKASLINPLDLAGGHYGDNSETLSNAESHSTILSPPQSSRRKAAEGGVRFAAFEDPIAELIGGTPAASTPRRASVTAGELDDFDTTGL